MPVKSPPADAPEAIAPIEAAVIVLDDIATTRPLASVVTVGLTLAEPYVPAVPVAASVGLGYVPVRSPPAAAVAPRAPIPAGVMVLDDTNVERPLASIDMVGTVAPFPYDPAVPPFAARVGLGNVPVKSPPAEAFEAKAPIAAGVIVLDDIAMTLPLLSVVMVGETDALP